MANLYLQSRLGAEGTSLYKSGDYRTVQLHPRTYEMCSLHQLHRPIGQSENISETKDIP